MSKSRNKLPVIGITMGDPKGIGPEIIRKVLASPKVKGRFHPVLFGDLEFFDYKKAASLTPKECGRLSGFYIEQAVQAILRKKIDAIVTAPISKEHLNLGGYPYPGHTEFLAKLSGTKHFRMMMAGPKLKVVLCTIHEPIARVPRLLNTGLILKTIEITCQSLHGQFNVKRPRIAVAALNPHAGEAGLFGDEEKTKITPAIRKAQRKGIDVSGPFPPDTIFSRAVHGEFDAVVVMYHDQGLIPLKLLHFDDAVNITLGLPFLRISVDHGTAFDIAGKGIASPSSMIAAIQTAIDLVQR